MVFDKFKDDFWQLYENGELLKLSTSTAKLTYSQVYNNIVSKFINYVESYFSDDLTVLFQTNLDFVNEISELDEDIENIISEMENVDFWVEEILNAFPELESL